jgi:hypothetical protein
VEGETEEEVMKRGAEHGKNVHGMKDEEFTPEFMQKEDLFVPPKNFFLFVQKD